MITPPSFGDYLRHLRTVGSVATFPAAPEPSRRPKLSRTKVAADAGISEGYLTKLEQGVADNPSSDLVDRLALALDAADLEHQHLRDLAAPPPAPAHDPDQRTTITPEHREFVDNVHPHLSGYVDEAWNVLYANPEYARIFRRIVDHGNVDRGEELTLRAQVFPTPDPTITRRLCRSAKNQTSTDGPPHALHEGARSRRRRCRSTSGCGSPRRTARTPAAEGTRPAGR